MAFDLSNYKTVAERIIEAKAIYPDGRFQTEVLFLADHPGYVAVKARFFRTQDDPTPGEGVAWEVVPGRTPYTKDSELQNAETSAWGRALVAAFAVDASKGIASREEVQSRQPQERSRSGPQKRTPKTPTPPEPTESHKKAPQADLEPDIAAEVKRLKNWAFKQLGGDVDRTKQIWAEVLATYDLKPDDLPLKESIQFIEADLSLEIGKALVGELVQPELVAEDERPFVA